MKYYAAVDIGASSGRVIAGWQEDGVIKTREVYRFPNGADMRGGHLVWDLDRLLSSVKAGIAAAKVEFSDIESLSVDTWGVDYVLMRDGEEIPPCFAYRDGRTASAVRRVHGLVPFPDLYRRTGIQFQPFNTVYQLFADKIAGRLDGATDFLMLPCWIMYKLCGVKAHEYTNATTGGLVSAETGEYDMSITDKLGLPRRLFPALRRPGAVLGEYQGIKVVLCATHDTASAVEGIPMEENAPYISSGTWSLLGVKTEKPITTTASQLANWSNEGGVGYNRYQKNIMGMWLVNGLQKELCPDIPFSELVRLAEESAFDGIVDANAPSLMSPKSMKAEFDALLHQTLESPGDYFRCACRSLAYSYMTAIQELQHNTGRSFDTVYIVGGGAKNGFLNRLTAEACGRRIIALPIEATALGNLKVQMSLDDPALGKGMTVSKI